MDNLSTSTNIDLIPQRLEVDQLSGDTIKSDLPVSAPKPVNRQEQLATIRSMWQFSAICQFLYLFQEAFDIADFDTVELEESLINPTHDWLEDFMIRYLRIGTKNRFVMPDTWLDYLSRELAKRDETIAFEGDYFTMDIQSRVLILHFICELQMERPETIRYIQEFNELDAARSWRIDPIGTDSNGITYWLFDDSRLYSEFKSHWKLECADQEQWVAFARRFEGSEHIKDKKLYTYISTDLIPLILRDLESIEHTRRDKRLRLEQEKQAKLKQELLAIVAKEEKQVKPVNDIPTQYVQQGGIRTRRSANLFIPYIPEAKPTRESRLQDREMKKILREAERIDSFPGGRSKKVSKYQEYSSEEEEEFTSEHDTIEEKPSTQIDETPEENKDDWFFDCICGKSGKNYDDGLPVVACEKCNVWQHIQCVSDHQNLSEWEGREFICDSCTSKITFDEDIVVDEIEPLEATHPLPPTADIDNNPLLALVEAIKDQ